MDRKPPRVMAHPKTKKLARLLGVSVPTVVGHLHGIWYWALDFAQDGDLHQYDPEEIADAALWREIPGSSSRPSWRLATSTKPTTASRFTTGMIMPAADRAARGTQRAGQARKQRQRERKKARAHEGHGEVTEESRGTPDDVTPLPYLTQPTRQNRTIQRPLLPFPPRAARGATGAKKSTRRAQV